MLNSEVDIEVNIELIAMYNVHVYSHLDCPADTEVDTHVVTQVYGRRDDHLDSP